MLKYSVFIILVLFIPTSGFAQLMTDDQIMNKYSNPNDLQNAIDRCEVDYNNLPNDSIKGSVHPTTTDCSVQPFQQDNTSPIVKQFHAITTIMWIVLPIVISVFVGIILLKHFVINGYKKDKTEDKTTRVSMDKIKTKEEHPMGDKTHD